MILLKRKVDDNMNKKGFTVVEVIVSFSILATILASIASFTVLYRGKVSEEQIRSKLLDFKNTITKVVYDDIVSGELKKMSYCLGVSNCVNLVDKNGNSTSLKVVEKTGNDKGLYINYKGIDYLLPDSNLNKSGKTYADFNSFSLQNYQDKIYTLKVTFNHYTLNEEYLISLTIN